MEGRKCYKCGETGHFIRECAKYWMAKARGVPFVSASFGAPGGRTGRSVAPVAPMDEVASRSRSADSNTSRHETEDTNALIRDCFAEMAREKKARREREELEEKNRKEEEARAAKERRRLQREEERQQREAVRDARLLRIIKAELRKEPSGSSCGQASHGKQTAKLNEYGETVEEEKERLRRFIAKHEEEEAEAEDEELRLLRLWASKLEIK
ncbi:hypothetical protein CBR_g8493 [Chara braunii]|uniref:CCHC-type domain-containing protein n=1 Tax=Chara braunii TaxID=69332 RepID=A0A388KMB2_CHABU|nr:hypothetical protein CBR_g8493 [Chara braunii]|eukprot:GBG71190.1 hypothetical protein CBR_g8493 [Chara braunii]